jgi:hypothetical protein
MPRVTQEFVVGSTTISQETVKGLHDELGKLGLPVERVGGESLGFDVKASARVKEFQVRYGLPKTGNLDPVTGGIMSVAALVATERDRGRLRTALVQAADDELFTPQNQANTLYKLWVARYAVMIRDYPLAVRVFGRSISEVNIEAIVRGKPRVAKPEVPFPENFYAYRYNIMSQEGIATLLSSRTPPDSNARQMLARRRPLNDNPEDDLDLPEPEEPPPPPPDNKERVKDWAEAWLRAVQAWQEGNSHFMRQRYSGAVAAYTRSQEETLNYFRLHPDTRVTLSGNTLDAQIDALASQFTDARWAGVRHRLNWRHQLLSLKELRDLDWRPIVSTSLVYRLLAANLAGELQPSPPVDQGVRPAQMDARLAVIAVVLVPLARGEANRLRRQYEAARRDFERVLRPVIPTNPPTNVVLNWKCEFIEVPFARLLLAETLFEQADTQYKSRMLVDELTDQNERTQALNTLKEVAQDFRTRNIPGHAGNTTRPLQHLLAAVTYAQVFQVLSDLGAYVPRTKEALNTLHASVAATIKTAPVGSHAFRSLGLTLTLPTVSPIRDSLPTLLDSKHPHQPYLKIEGSGPEVISERNPRVYALLLQTQARLLQIWSGFNYLGYPDDHVPTWRFSFLLDRARYFAEHAKNAQREYLNFLGNAEREEFQELTASQNVELEKSNIRIETARVEQAQFEVAASQESLTLATTSAQSSRTRRDGYREFDDEATRLEGISFVGNTIGGFFGAVASSIVNPAAAGASFASFLGNTLGAGAELEKTRLQRDLELQNLGLAIKEAEQAQNVAKAQLDAVQAGLLVATMQRQAALLRHEFAIQNLAFLRNRTLNAELWYRLSGAIRSVADTYLRYGIEMAFLAEQAYEFEADKRLDVIRFDYDVSDLGDMLAGDFLLRDLNTLEQDLIVGQKLRQQQVKYVLSLAREFPEALQELRDKGVMTFTLRLEQLERRFPGLFNLRISSVEVLPVALMDATRFSLELTYLGSGQVRLKTKAGTPAPTTPPPPPPPANTGEWLVGVDTDWAVRPRIMGPETAIFSGLSQQSLGGTAAFFAAHQRGAFEGLPGASSWRIDLSMKENRVVPDTLVDVLLTFTLSGYYDANLRAAVDRARRRPLASTTWFSAQQSFPDAYYQFNRTGLMEWTVTQEQLALQGSLGALQNVAVLCVPSQKRPELGRLMCSYPVEFNVDSAGRITLLREMPHVSLTTRGLTLTATVKDGLVGTFDYGDGSGLSHTLTHEYKRPGRYEVLIRLVTQGGLLTEYHAIVVVSRQQTLLPPCITVPQLEATVADRKVKIRPTMVVPSGERFAVSWQIDGKPPDSGSGPVTFTVESGRHVLRFTAVRPLKARFHSQQRHAPTVPLAFDSLHLATNRTFDVTTGDETTTTPNAFGRHVFAAGATLSPTDRWTLEFPLDENPSLVSVSSADSKQHDLGELADVFLALEYKVSDE